MRIIALISALVLSIFMKCEFAVKANSQTPISQVSFNTLADMRAQAGSTNVMANLTGLTTATDSNGGMYMWISTSTATDDGFITIAVTGTTTGRWVRIGNANTIKGQTTVSGGALQTAYTIPYIINGASVTLPYTPITVLIQARSSNAAVPSWVSTISTTGFVVNFSSVPVLGTNNITIDYIVVKQ